MYLSCARCSFQLSSPYGSRINSLPNNKILASSRLKTFAENKLKVCSNYEFIHNRIENSVGKGENAGYQHFLLFPKCFQKPFFQGC